MNQVTQKRIKNLKNSKIYMSLMLGVIICFGILAIFSIFQQPRQELSGSQKPGALKSAPLFELVDDQGKMHSLKEYHGKWILIHFWANWCPPCRGEIPDWIELRKSLPNSAPIQFIGVSLDPNWEEAHQLLPSHLKVPGLVSLRDPHARVPEAYGTYNYPETYLLNPNLKILTKWVGPQKWSAPETIEFFKKLLSEDIPVSSP